MSSSASSPPLGESRSGSGSDHKRTSSPKPIPQSSATRSAASPKLLSRSSNSPKLSKSSNSPKIIAQEMNIMQSPKKPQQPLPTNNAKKLTVTGYENDEQLQGYHSEDEQYHPPPPEIQSFSQPLSSSMPAAKGGKDTTTSTPQNKDGNNNQSNRAKITVSKPSSSAKVAASGGFREDSGYSSLGW